MSLINDALKRAHRNAAQTRPSPVDGIAFRPSEPGKVPRRNLWLIAAVAAVACAFLGFAGVKFFWVRGKHNGEEGQKTMIVNAREVAPEKSRTESVESQAVTDPVIEPASPRPTASGQTSVTTSASGAQPADSQATPVTSGLVAAAASQPGPSTNNPNKAEAVKPAVPQPDPWRLQGIVYHPTRPSAMINGKTVFVGERVQGMKVVGITKDTATLAADGTTKVLRLAE